MSSLFKVFIDNFNKFRYYKSFEKIESYTILQKKLKTINLGLGK